MNIRLTVLLGAFLLTATSGTALAGPGDPLKGINGSLTASGAADGSGDAECQTPLEEGAADPTVGDIHEAECGVGAQAGPGDPLTGINGSLSVHADNHGDCQAGSYGHSGGDGTAGPGMGTQAGCSVQTGMGVVSCEAGAHLVVLDPPSPTAGCVGPG